METRLVVALLCSCALGCGSDGYNAKKNADVRRLTSVEFKDVKAEQIYRERDFAYPNMRGIGYGQKQGGGVYVGGSTNVSAGAGAIIGAAVLVTAVAVDASRGETEKRRTARLNTALPAWDMQADLRRQLTTGMRANGYKLTAPLPIADKRIPAGKPPKLGKGLPRLNKKDWETHLGKAAASDGMLNVQVMNYGIMKIERAFKDARYLPYVVLDAKLYRRDSGKAIWEASYLGLPIAPLPKTGDFDPAIADTRLVKQFYDEALTSATRLLVEDLRPAWAGK